MRLTDSCSFRRPDSSRCGSSFGVKEVEFKHPSYKDLSKTVYVCQSHFFEVFGEYVAKKASLKPLEMDKWLELQVRNEQASFRRTLAETRKAVRTGIGTEHFDWETWKATNGRKLDDLKIRLSNLRRKTCRFEWCQQELENYRNIYTIRVYPKNPREYVNLFFCSLDHWEIYKKRIGIEQLKGTLDPDRKKASVTLDAYQ